MAKDDPLLALLVSFAPMSLMAVGGGLSIMGDVQRLAIAQGWFTPEGFNEIFALSRVAPGPATLIVTLIGWHVMGLAGAVTATLAIFVPSSTLTYVVARLWHSHPGADWRKPLARGLAPIAAALLLSSAIALLRGAAGREIAWTVAGLTALLSWNTRLGPLVLLAIGGAAFVAMTTAFG